MDLNRIEEINNLIEQLEIEKEQIKSKQLLDKYAKFDSYIGKFVRKIGESGEFVFKPISILYDEECFEGTTVTEKGLKFNWIYFEGVGECKFEILTPEEVKQIKIESINSAIKDLNEFFV